MESTRESIRVPRWRGPTRRGCYSRRGRPRPGRRGPAAGFGRACGSVTKRCSVVKRAAAEAAGRVRLEISWARILGTARKPRASGLGGFAALLSRSLLAVLASAAIVQTPAPFSPARRDCPRWSGLKGAAGPLCETKQAREQSERAQRVAAREGAKLPQAVGAQWAAGRWPGAGCRGGGAATRPTTANLRGLSCWSELLSS